MKRTLLALLFAGASLLLPQEIKGGYQVKVTYYLPTGNVMRSGIYPFVGAAACSPDISDVGNGQYNYFWLQGYRFQCLDTGGGVLWQHVDIFCGYWEQCIGFRQSLGTSGEILIEWAEEY